MTSRVSKKVTVSQLKQSWTVAPAKASSNCLLSDIWVRETRVLVRLVPMLAPITIGMDVRTSKTGRRIGWIMNEMYLHDEDLDFHWLICVLYLHSRPSTR